MRAIASAARARSVRSPAATSAAKSSRPPMDCSLGGCPRLAELDHVAVGIADPELGAAEVEVGHTARVEGLSHQLDALHPEREVRIGRVDVLEHLPLLDEMELRAAQVVPGAGEAQVRARRHPQAEQALVERARAGEVRDADGSVIEAAHMDVAHVTSRSSTRKVASGPIRNHDPIQAIQYLRARRSRMRPSSTGSVTTRARPRTRSSPTSSATFGVLRRLRTQSRFAFRVAR